MSMPKPPDIQVWIAEFDTAEKQEECLNRYKQIEGCTVLFVGKSSEGKGVIIHSITGKANDTPEVKFNGNRRLLDEPRLEQLAGWSIYSSFKITQSIN